MSLIEYGPIPKTLFEYRIALYVLYSLYLCKYLAALDYLPYWFWYRLREYTLLACQTQNA